MKNLSSEIKFILRQRINLLYTLLCSQTTSLKLWCNCTYIITHIQSIYTLSGFVFAFPLAIQQRQETIVGISDQCNTRGQLDAQLIKQRGNGCGISFSWAWRNCAYPISYTRMESGDSVLHGSEGNASYIKLYFISYAYLFYVVMDRSR